MRVRGGPLTERIPTSVRRTGRRTVLRLHRTLLVVVLACGGLLGFAASHAVAGGVTTTPTGSTTIPPPDPPPPTTTPRPNPPPTPPRPRELQPPPPPPPPSPRTTSIAPPPPPPALTQPSSPPRAAVPVPARPPQPPRATHRRRRPTTHRPVHRRPQVGATGARSSFGPGSSTTSLPLLPILIALGGSLLVMALAAFPPEALPPPMIRLVVRRRDTLALAASLAALGAGVGLVVVLLGS